MIKKNLEPQMAAEVMKRRLREAAGRRRLARPGEAAQGEGAATRRGRGARVRYDGDDDGDDGADDGEDDDDDDNGKGFKTKTCCDHLHSMQS